MKTQLLVMVAIEVEGPNWGLTDEERALVESDPGEYQDLWGDKFGQFLIFTPKRGDFIIESNTDYNRHWVGEVIASAHPFDAHYPELFAVFTPETLAEKCAAVSAKLVEHFGVTERPKLHVITVVQ